MRIVYLLSMFLVCAAPNVADAKRFKVVTTFTVIADMARNVAGDVADVESITRPGAEIHGYQPTPKDILRAQGADLILWNGLNLEIWFEQFFRNLSNVPSVIVSDGVEPIGIGAGAYEGKPNPHAWMGLSNALIYIDNIRNAFSELDPENAAKYAQNAADYKQRVIQTIEPLRKAILSIPVEKRWLVSSEGAFSYLARDFEMEELYIWPINADQQGTPKQVRNVIDKIRNHDIAAVFSESTISPKPAQQIARETDARYGGVLYVDSLSGEDGPVPTYLDLLRVTIETLISGLAAE